MRAILAALLLCVAGCAEGHPRHSVRLDFDRGICTGTVVGRDILLTAQHCFDSGGRLLKIDGEEHYALKIISDGKDHALVRVTKRFSSWAAMGPPLAAGDEVEWLGNPAGVNGVFRRGYVMRVSDDEVWVSAEAFGGDSGSALVDSRSRVRGVLTGVRVWRDRSGNTFTAVVIFPMRFTKDDWLAIR